MSESKKKKKKVITTSSKSATGKKTITKKKIAPTVSRRKNTGQQKVGTTLLFGRENYKWALIGIGIIILGFVLMSGGSMPSPDVWDDSLIYSFRRITLAPIVILIGLGVEVYAIFK